jgi:putative nucleotidyltransferase with HDIG domain
VDEQRKGVGWKPPDALDTSRSAVSHRLPEIPHRGDVSRPVDNGRFDGSTRTSVARADRPEQPERAYALSNSQDRGLTAQPAYTPSGGLASKLRNGFSANRADRNAAIWAVILVAAAIATAGALVRAGYSIDRIWVVVLLGVVAAIAERQGVAVTDRINMSVALLPNLFVAIAFGPLAAFVASAISNASDFRPLLRWFVYTPIRAITGAVAGLAAWTVMPHAASFAGYLLASLAASVANLATDAGLNALTLVVRRASLRDFAQALGPLFFVSVPLYVPVIALFVYGYRVYSLWVVVAFFIPALALQRVFHLYQQQREVTRRLEVANERLTSANLSFATALVATLDARDRYTAGHSAAVAIYARDIAERMGLSEDEQNLIHLCGLVHDVGKIGLPAGLLEKPGALSLEERRQMEKHPEIGEQILRKVDDYGEIADVVRSHHERVDGLGYPDGLCGDDIPPLARIIAVADAYNAMTSDRPYRDALPSRVARLRLAQAVESQFDTSVVAAFEAILASADEEYRMGTSEAFVLESATYDSVAVPPPASVAVSALS